MRGNLRERSTSRATEDTLLHRRVAPVSFVESAVTRRLPLQTGGGFRAPIRNTAEGPRTIGGRVRRRTADATGRGFRSIVAASRLRSCRLTSSGNGGECPARIP